MYTYPNSKILFNKSKFDTFSIVPLSMPSSDIEHIYIHFKYTYIPSELHQYYHASANEISIWFV